jgi:hypothetical protein
MASKKKKATTRKKRPATKRCASCEKTKPLKEFGKNPRMRLGRKSYCRACSRDKQREWNAAQRAPVKKKSGTKRKSRRASAELLD